MRETLDCPLGESNPPLPTSSDPRPDSFIQIQVLNTGAPARVPRNDDDQSKPGIVDMECQQHDGNFIGLADRISDFEGSTHSDDLDLEQKMGGSDNEEVAAKLGGNMEEEGKGVEEQEQSEEEGQDLGPQCEEQGREESLAEDGQETHTGDLLLHDVASRDCQCSVLAKELGGQIYELPREMVYGKSWEVLERVRMLGIKHFCFNHLRHLASKGFKMLNSKKGITKEQLVSRLE